MVGQNFLGPGFVQAQPQRQRVRAGVGQAQHLADRGDVGLAVGAVQPFGDVEDHVGPEPAQGLIGVGIRFNGIDGVLFFEAMLYGANGFLGVAFGQ